MCVCVCLEFGDVSLYPWETPRDRCGLIYTRGDVKSVGMSTDSLVPFFSNGTG